MRQKYPPRISTFAFDLQRFTEWTLTQEEGANVKLTSGEVEYTGTTNSIIATAVAGDEENSSKLKLATGDTIKLGGDITWDGSGDNGRILFNSGIALTLNLDGHSIVNNNAKGECPIGIGTKTSTSENNLTIIGSGAITATGNHAGIMFWGTGNTTTYSKLVIGSEDGSDTISISGGTYGVSGNGTANHGEGTDITINKGVTITATGKESTGIYNPQYGKLTINGAEIKGTDTGIEIRSGELTVNGGTITSTSPEYSCTPNSNGTTTKGAGIAVAQHVTKQNMIVNINGGEISGAVAFSVANPEGGAEDEGNITANINGGTFTSTATDQAAIAARNTDHRVTLNISKGTFSGALESDFLKTEDGKAAINLLGPITLNGQEVSAPVTYKENSTDTLALTGAVGWNANSKTKNQWDYVEKLATATEDGLTGQVILKVPGVTDSANLAFDVVNSIIAVPDDVTPTWAEGFSDGSKYKLATLKYNSSSQTAVTVSTSTAGAVIDADNLLANTVEKIDARDNSVALEIKGNALNNTIYGGAGNDTLTGGEGADTFFFSGGADKITDYTAADKVSLLASANLEPVTDASKVAIGTGNDTANLILDFGNDDSLTFVGGATNTAGVSIQSGRNTYVYTANSIAQGKGITLAAGESFNAGEGDYATVDASAVTTAFSITGNSLNNVIRGGSNGGQLAGGTGSDTVSGGAGSDTFVYTAGKDVIENYGTGDSVSLGTEITGGKYSNGSLIFSTADKSNTLTLKDVDETAQIALSGGGYLTKDGNLSGTKLTLFKDSGGRIEQASGIEEIDARNVSNKVTLVGASGGGQFTFGSNKKNDLFEYGGGAATLTGYEAGKDKVNLAYKFNSFDVSGQNVSLSTDKGDLILQDALNKEINIANGSNRYSKMIFASKGVIADKAKNPTSVTLYSGISDYTASDRTIKKINFADGVSAMNITGNDKANVIDLSKVTLGNDSSGFTISSGAGNDKITGSDKADSFTYTGGKDAISNYDSTDSISIGTRKLDDAKITANKKSITFKFSSKDSLTIKSKNNIGSLNIGGTSYSFKKNAVKTGNSVDLTNNFSGTFKVESGVSTVDGSDAKKSLTLTGTSAAESLVGGTKKTKFKGGGGQDTLVGNASGEDTFYFAKKDAAGDVTVANFDYAKDKLKIASKTLSNISTSGALGLTLTNSEKVTLQTGTDASTTVDVNNVLLKANNTLYWFDSDGVTLTGSDGEAGETYGAGWFTFSKKNSDMTEVMRNYKKGGYAVVDLGYSTNLVTAKLATKVDESKVYSNSTGFDKSKYTLKQS